jgi:IS30 family transposase
MTKTYKHLSVCEREQIEMAYWEGQSIRAIAKELNERPRCSLNYDPPEEVLKRGTFNLPK